MTPKISMNFICRKCEGNIGEAVELEGKQYDEVEAVLWMEKSMVRAICGVQLKDIKISKDLMLHLNETMDLLAMANSVRW